MKLLFGMPPRMCEQDLLQELGNKLDVERLFFLMDHQVETEELFWKHQDKKEEKDRIPIGSQVLIVKLSKETN